MSYIDIAEIIGTISFAITGYLAGTKARLDLLGVAIAAFLTAIGGGIIRDTIVGKIPYSLENSFMPILILLVIFFSVLLRIDKKGSFEKGKIMLFSDTIGLVSFSITGALIAISSDLNFFGVILLSVITATGGGIMRDILVNNIPFVLNSDFYATISILVASTVYVLNIFELLNNYTMLILFIIGILIRLLAYKRGWKLPLTY